MSKQPKRGRPIENHSAKANRRRYLQTHMPFRCSNPKCGDNLRVNMIRLREGMFECRKCGTVIFPSCEDPYEDMDINIYE